MDSEFRDVSDGVPAESFVAQAAANPPVTADVSRHGRASNRWLVAAIGATVVCGLLASAILVGIQRTPLDSTPLPLVAEEGPGTQPLTVAIARTPGGPSEWANWARVIKYVSEDVGVPVSLRYLTKEDQATDVISKEDIDVAFVCAHQYLDLSDAGVVEGLCTPIVNGSSTTTYMLVVRKDDPAQRLEDLAGSVVAASDKSSLGGYAYLSYLCQEHSLVASEFFGELRLGDTQDSDIRAVLDGSIRATVVASSQMLGWDQSGLRTIERSEPVGCPPVVVNVDLDPELRERIRASLLTIDTDTALPSDSYIGGFVPLDEDAYAFAKVLRGACGHHEDE